MNITIIKPPIMMASSTNINYMDMETQRPRGRPVIWTRRIKAFVKSQMKNKHGEMSILHKALALLLFISINLVGGFALGRLTSSNHDWDDHLVEPVFRPPDWVFGPTWTLIYIVMATAGWRMYTINKFNGQRRGAYVMQLILNFLWVPLYYGWHHVFLALIDIVFLLVAIVWTTVVFKLVDNLAALLFVPYFLWVTFATCLNAAVWWMNYDDYGFGSAKKVD